MKLDLDTILDAISSLVNVFPDLQIHIIDSDKTSNKNIKLNNKIQNLTVHRYASTAEIWHIIAQSNIYISNVFDSSNYEYLLHSKILKTPTISFSSEISKELFSTHDIFSFTNISDKNLLIETIKKILNTDRKINTKTLNRKSEPTDKFSLKTHVNSLHSIFSEIILNKEHANHD